MAEIRDTERTTEELQDILSAGNCVKVVLGRSVWIDVTLGPVDVVIRHPLIPDALRILTEGLANDQLWVGLQHPLQVLGDTGLDPAENEVELLKRVLQARARLLEG